MRIEVHKITSRAYRVSPNLPESKETIKKHIAEGKRINKLGLFSKGAECKYNQRTLSGFLR